MWWALAIQKEPFSVCWQEQERHWEQKGKVVLQASLRLPDSKSKGAAARRFRRYYRLYARCFFRYCQKQLLPQAAASCRLSEENGLPFLPLQVLLQTTVTLQQDGILSLYTQMQENSQRRPFFLRRSDSWDLTCGYPLRLEDCFPQGVSCRALLLSQAAEQLRQRLRLQPYSYREDALQRLRRCFNRENFYLTETGLCLFYPMYALASASERIPVFSFPYGEQGPCLPGTGRKQAIPARKKRKEQ